MVMQSVTEGEGRGGCQNMVMQSVTEGEGWLSEQGDAVSN